MRNYFKKIGQFIKHHQWWFVAALILLLAVIFINRDSGPEYQRYQVSVGDVVDAVELTGSVSAVDRANLSFQSTGQVQSINVEAGDQVSRGDVIARLDPGTLNGELSQAKAAVAAARASLEEARSNLSLVRANNSTSLTTIESARLNLQEVTAEQNQLVENARLTLMTSGLEAYPVDPNSGVDQPIVTGTYTGNTEGEYVLDFYRSSNGSGYSARFSGLETGVVGFPDNSVAMPLGTRGLYISLPESTSSYTYTDFVVPIPNQRSASYQSLLNAYNLAKETRNRTIASAQNQLDQLVAAENNPNQSATTATERQALARVASAQASLDQANANVTIINSRLSDRVLRAPFSGLVAKLDLEVGENVPASQAVVTLVSDGDYEIELQVPEIDVARLQEGMTAVIRLDAYSNSTTWQGQISAIERIETIVEGVPVYITTITVTNPDERIRIGMNARAEVVLQEVSDVIAIPESYLQEEAGRVYVLIESQTGEIVEQGVTTGLEGANSMTEIVSGLEPGQIVIKAINDET